MNQRNVYFQCCGWMPENQDPDTIVQQQVCFNPELPG